MIELRWVVEKGTSTKNAVLEYRHHVPRSPQAIGWGEQTWMWSDWKEVPTVECVAKLKQGES